MSGPIQCGDKKPVALEDALERIHLASESNLKTLATYQHGPDMVAQSERNTRTVEYNIVIAMRNAFVDAIQPSNVGGVTLPAGVIEAIHRDVLTPSLNFAQRRHEETLR